MTEASEEGGVPLGPAHGFTNHAPMSQRQAISGPPILMPSRWDRQDGGGGGFGGVIDFGGLLVAFFKLLAQERAGFLAIGIVGGGIDVDVVGVSHLEERK